MGKQSFSYQAMAQSPSQATPQARSANDEPGYVMVETSSLDGEHHHHHHRPHAIHRGYILGLNFQLPECLGGTKRAQIVIESPDAARNFALGHDEEYKREEIREQEEEMQEELNEIEIEEADMLRRKDELTGFFSSRVNELETELEEMRKKKRQLYRLLEDLRTEPEVVILPDPEWLHFVEECLFHTVANCVIIANIVVMVMQVTDKSSMSQYASLDWGLNNAFMVWYVVEICLRALLWRELLLCGEFSRVIWNWMDLLIVCSGVIELWMYPLFQSAGLVQGDRSSVRWLRFLRLGRILRIFKLLHTFLESDLSWAHGHRFQIIMMCVICANCIIIGLECDLDDFWGWKLVEQALLIVFSFEITVRLKHDGCKYFWDPHDWMWNWLDFIIVGGGVVDQWLLPSIDFLHEMLGDEVEHKQSNVGQIMMLLRMARLLRILRLVRLIHSIGPLYQLIITIVTAMQGMCWVLLLTMVLLYIFALLAVKLISHGLIFGGEAPPEVARIFPNVPQAIFVLFQVMNGDAECLDPLFQAMPLMQIFFMLFTVLSSWAILSILTAVVSENMIRSAEEHRNEVYEQEKNRQEALSNDHLDALFNEVDNDGDGFLTEEEYMALLEDKNMVGELKECTGIVVNDLKLMWAHLSRHDSESGADRISRKDFVEGLLNEKRPVSERSIMRLEKRLHDVELKVNKKIDKVKMSQDAAFGSGITSVMKGKTTRFAMFGGGTDNDSHGTDAGGSRS